MHLLIHLLVVVFLGLPLGLIDEMGGESHASEQLSSVVMLRPDSDGVQRATIRLTSYKFQPNHLSVQVGYPVELVLVNESFLVPHNFVLHAPEAGLDINQSVGAGETAVVRFTPRQAGTYVFFCDKQLLFFPSHREEGMEGQLDVRTQADS
ncbi:MAG: quinol oxidase [Nitrospirae bacterium]|nr:MAG: quinol oxidase [Nitrospirota bacterium]